MNDEAEIKTLEFRTEIAASVPGGTEVTVEQDVLAGYEDFMNDTWPKALVTLKALCETD